MKNVSHKKVCDSGKNPAHVEPLPIPPTKENYNGKSDEYFVNLKLRRDTTSSTLDLYELKTYFFDHDNPEEFLLLIRNFNMNIAAIGTLETDAKIQYLCMIVRGESLRQFELLSAEI